MIIKYINLKLISVKSSILYNINLMFFNVHKIGV